MKLLKMSCLCQNAPDSRLIDLVAIDIGVVKLYFKGTARSFQKNWWHFKREWITKICYDVFISNQIFTMFRVTTGCPTKSYSSRHPSQPDLDEPVSGNYFFGRFLLRLSRIKRFQVMPRGKFGSAGCSTQFRLGFLGFSSILKVTFLWTPYILGQKRYMSAFLGS